MRNVILSWYAYAESGEAAPVRRPDTPTATLDNPTRVSELFHDARRLDAEMTPQGWKHLWSRYGLEGLIDLARGADFPPSTPDDEVADALMSESLAAGYDPVSGEFGWFDDERRTFEPVGNKN
jgi:hypothetical protein